MTPQYLDRSIAAMLLSSIAPPPFLFTTFETDVWPSEMRPAVISLWQIRTTLVLGSRCGLLRLQHLSGELFKVCVRA